MADLDEYAMAKLAREMAMAIRNYKDIFADFGVTEEDYYEIAKNDFYKRAKEQFALEWNSTLSTSDRVKITSAAGAEQGLLAVTRRMLDPNEPFPGVLSAFKQLCQNAGIGDPKVEQKSNERFIIQINLGADTETYDKSVAVDVNDISQLTKIKTIAANKDSDG
jgi:hypothetical protein